MKIPFGWLPGSWGLRGKARARAEAEYLLSGIELDRRLVEIEYEPDTKEYKLKNLEIDLKYNKISQYDYDKACIIVNSGDDEITREIGFLELDLKNNKISQSAFAKQVATLRKEPYVGVLNTDYNHDLGINGLFMELDWNEEFVQMLLANGYTGVSDEVIVNKWFDHICQSISDEHEDNNNFVSTNNTSRVRKTRHDNGLTEIG